MALSQIKCENVVPLGVDFVAQKSLSIHHKSNKGLYSIRFNLESYCCFSLGLIEHLFYRVNLS